MFYKKEGLPEEGELTVCTVKKILPHSVFVNLDEYENKEGMVHISQLQDKRTERVDEVVKPGDTVVVRVREVDERGRINLTMRGITKEEKDKALAE